MKSALLIFFCLWVANAQLPPCPQNDEVPIPSGTDAEILQYAIDGHRCIILWAEDSNLRATRMGMLDAVNKLYEDAEAMCNPDGISKRIHEITHNATDSIYAVATAAFAKQIRLNDAVWKKIEEKNIADSCEKDIINVMKRVHRVSKRNLSLANIVVARSLPQIVEVNEEAACKITKLLRRCKPGRKSEEIAKIRQEAMDQAMQLSNDASDRVLSRQAKIFAALAHGIEYTRENSD